MLETLAKEFLTSSIAGEAIDALKKEAGLDQATATSALSATAEGAASAVSEGGLSGAVGGLFGGGVAGALGGLFGGADNSGGGGGLLGGLLGGSNESSASGLPPAIVDRVVAFVVEKAGLDEAKARLAVNVVLPKVMAFVKEKMA